MGWSDLFLRALTVSIGALVGLVSIAAPAVAAAAGAPGGPPATDPWVVDRPRFEPLDSSPLGVAGEGEFRGSIELTNPSGGLAVINHVGLDDYLRGISEVPVSWPLEAQKAQAIAARTYALYEVGRKVNASYKAAGADICATDACQVYAGLAKERRPGSEAWNAAVAQTTGQVLLYKGAPIVAKYSSSNGGRSVSGGQPYLRATDDPDDRYSPLHQWMAAYPLADVVRVAGFAPETVDVRRNGDEVVATAVDAEGMSVEQRVAATDFRLRLLGAFASPAGLPTAVPSIRYDAATVDGEVRLAGRGWGHGIGLSQYGALGKALRGLQAPDILAAYYAGLRPVDVPADRLPSQVRVAVSLDRAGAAVASAGGQFRIVDARGDVIAHRADGTWRAEPAAKGKVRLLPPADQAGAPGAVVVGADRTPATPGRPLALELELVGPSAITRLVLVSPDGATTVLDPPTLRPAGPLTLRLAAATLATPGRYRLDVERDAGGGRVATTALDLDVEAPSPPGEGAPSPAAPAGPVAGSPLSSDGGAGVAASTVALLRGLATVMLLAVVVVAAGGWWVGRRPGLPLH